MTIEITQAPQTVRDYIRRARYLLDRAQREIYPDLDDDHVGVILPPKRFVQWLADRRPQITSNTWRQDKASVACYFRQYPDDSVYVAALDQLMPLRSDGCKRPRTGQTSSKKAKAITERDASRLISALRGAIGDWGPRAALFFEVTLIAGLRPSEWEHAKVADGGLLVKNAKATNGRANGEYRAIPLSPADIAACRRNIDEISRWMTTDGRPFSAYLKSIRKSINRESRRVFNRASKPGKGISAYTARHQCVANLKNIYSPAGVAALMGHASEKTAKWHYARRGRGWDKFKATRRDLEAPMPAPRMPE
jgi:integrase